jgi:uncharacterized protein (DUF305 family)
VRELFIKEPCSDKLSDKEYLLHMIPHHQVAVDISYLLQDKTKSPVMQEIIRKLIWTQRYEIKLMEEMLTKLPKKDMSNDNIVMKKNYIVSKSDLMKPNKLGISDTYCDPHFFDPEAHMNHMKHMKLDEKMYIKHMIPHHQVAVDMSKKLLKNTKNDFMIYLAYRIIRSQQAEITLLNNLLNKENYFHTSELMI